ncbi:MAG: DedA family protein [Acidimicrobiales bacterium]
MPGDLGLLGLLNPTTFVASSGYAAIFILCVAQSCCVPTSSELTMGFAGVLAATGKLNLAAAIGIGATGEVVGAYIAWVIGRTGGRAFVDRYGKYLLLSHADLDRAEAWYSRHQRWGVFGSRLVPLVRNFAALPAGVAEVPLLRFGLLTAAGSLLWDGAMAGIGYGVGSKYQSIMHGFSDAGYLLGAIAVLAIAVVIWHRFRTYRAASSAIYQARTPRAQPRHAGGPRHAAGPKSAPSSPGVHPDPISARGAPSFRVLPQGTAPTVAPPYDEDADQDG